MGTRTSQLQIRITPAEKATLKRLAAEAGESVSRYVLSRVLRSLELEVAEIFERLADRRSDHRAVLSELAGMLERLSGEELAGRVRRPDPDTLPPVLLNCVTALVETAAHRKGVEPPSWVRLVPPLPRPHYGWALQSLKPHQLRVAPIPFKRRNIFFDPAVGAAP